MPLSPSIPKPSTTAALPPHTDPPPSTMSTASSPSSKLPSEQVSRQDVKVEMPKAVIQHHPLHTHLNQIYAGAISGCITRAFTQPFDVLKIRFQLQVEPVSKHAPHTSKYTSVWQAIGRIFREEGMKAFWKGHNAGQFTSISYGVVQFYGFEQSKVFLDSIGFLHRHYHVADFLAGGMGGLLAICVSTPFDVIRTRIVAQDHGSGYRSTMGAIPIIYRAEGLQGLFRGMTLSICQIIPLVGANFMFYRGLNEIVLKAFRPEENYLPTWWLLTSGGLAGIGSKIVVYPLDFVKKRVQMRGFEDHRKTFGRNQVCKGIKDCIVLTYRDEKFWGFYKGLTPTLLKTGTTSALYFAVYDKVKAILDKYN